LQDYQIWYRVVAYMLVMFVIPFSILIVVNVLIVRTLRVSQVNRNHMTAGVSQSLLANGTSPQTNGKCSVRVAGRDSVDGVLHPGPPLV
jgi:hypothetical protein